MKFSGVVIFKKALKEWAISRGYTFELNKNTATRITTLCKKRCGFRIYASRLDDNLTFQIKTFQLEQKCLRDFYNPLISSEYLSEKFISELKENPKWEVRAMQKTL